MIIIKEGSILEAEENIIGHQVNCFKIGAGIAKQIIDKYPIVYKKHKEVCKLNNMYLLGRCQFVEIGKDKYIANIFSQYRYGTDKLYTRYDSLLEALCELKNEAEYRYLSIALPYYIGCGRGGGDVELVHEIIKSVFWDYNVTLYKL